MEEEKREGEGGALFLSEGRKGKGEKVKGRGGQKGREGTPKGWLTVADPGCAKGWGRTMASVWSASLNGVVPSGVQGRAPGMGVFRGGGAQSPQKIVVLPRRRIDWRHFSCCNARRIGYESQMTQLRSVVLTN